MNYGRAHRVETGLAILVVGIALAAGKAIAQPHPATVPDAQVESNVLKALASDSRLADKAIKSTTVYGTVTLSGTVPDEATRTDAETIVSRTTGVTKVIDELTLSGGTGDTRSASAADPTPAPNPTPQAGRGLPPQDQQPQANSSVWGPAGPPPAADEEEAQPDQRPMPTDQHPMSDGGQAQGPSGQPYPPQYGPPSGYPQSNPQNYPSQSANGQPGYGGPQYPSQSPYGGAPQPPYGTASQPPSQPPYGSDPNYGRQPGYGAPPQYPYGSGPNYGGQQGYNTPPPPPNGANPNYAGQQGGLIVNIPSGTVLRVRLNQGVSSRGAQPGNIFHGVVVNDVVASGAIAIPRGASVQGVVVDAESAGVLKGRGELQLKLTQVTLGGTSYPLTSTIWATHSGDKTVQTVDSAVGLGAAGAVIGAIAGGGAGAAIGAGVGGTVGLGASAASGTGQIGVPPEAILDFHLTEPVQVATLSQDEMNRLGYGVPAGEPRGIVRRYPGSYYGPVVYGPGYYGPAYYGPGYVYGPRYYPRRYRYYPY